MTDGHRADRKAFTRSAVGAHLALALSGMDEKDRRSTVRRADDRPRRSARTTIDTAANRSSTTLWRMRSAADDNRASCSVTEHDDGCCDVLIVFSKGFGVPEHFTDIAAAMRHSMEIAGRLAAQKWVEIELADE